MLTGDKFGAALDAAMKIKGVGTNELARAIGVKPPSVTGWKKTGSIDKKHLSALFRFFAPEVGPEHWGLSDQSKPPLDGAAKFVESSRGLDVGPSSQGDEMSEFETMVFLGLLRKMSPERRTELVAQLMAESPAPEAARKNAVR